MDFVIKLILIVNETWNVLLLWINIDSRNAQGYSIQNVTSTYRATYKTQHTCHPDIRTAAQCPAEWMDSRRSHLTASNFEEVCRMRETTSSAKTVWRLLYNEIKVSNATHYGTESEYQTEAEYIEHLKQNGLSNIVIEHPGFAPIHVWSFLISFAWWCCLMQPSNTTREVFSGI